MQGNIQQYWRCKQCRTKLFDTVEHGQKCSSYFITPPKWLPPAEINQHKLNCPKCRVKIGEVVWSGKKCSCLQWLTPAIQVHHQKVDRIRPLAQ